MFGPSGVSIGTHAPVVGGVDVAHLDGRALAGEPARAQRREAPAVREAGQRVGLVHELRELRGAEELLQRRHHRPDVDDRLRRDGVDVLGAHALADDALHPVEADAEGLLDELADRAQAPVAEVLVLVQLPGDLVAGHGGRVGGEVLGLLRQADADRQAHQAADQLHQVVGHVREAAGEAGAGERAHAGAHLQAEARVELVAADLREVVALGVEEQRAHQRARVVHRRRLSRALLLEDLDEGVLHDVARAGVQLLLELLDLGLDVGARLGGRVVHALGQLVDLAHDRRDLVQALAVARLRLALRGVLVQRRLDERVHPVGVRRVAEEVGDVVARVAEGEQQRRDRQLALAVDADVHEALLVDLQLHPRPARRHQVRDEDLLLAVLGLHHVGARRAHELGHDDPLGAVDDVGAPVGHEGQVAHEDLLLPDLTGLPVDEGDLHRQGGRVGEVLLAAVLDRLVRLDVVERHAGLPAAQRVAAELHGKGPGEVLDRGDVVDGLAQALVEEPLERGALDVDEVWDLENLLEARERTAARAAEGVLKSRGLLTRASEGRLYARRSARQA